ncbi:hypothetical protein, partial [Haemophilus influenzae]|uniref:hypothetical protein n=1 Tax=Haemophilus influenzae TaxID=727 RepID=UPI0019530BE4
SKFGINGLMVDLNVGISRCVGHKDSFNYADWQEMFTYYTNFHSKHQSLAFKVCQQPLKYPLKCHQNFQAVLTKSQRKLT